MNPEPCCENHCCTDAADVRQLGCDRSTTWKGIDVTEVGDTLRRRRVELGWTMRTLEEASGVDDAVISRIENGEIAQPRLDKITRMATALGLDPMTVIAEANDVTVSQPSLDAYLTARYPGLPDTAVQRIERYVERVLRDYNINPHQREEVR